MERLKQAFPAGVDYRIVYDPTVFVRNSITAVVETLFEAIFLVVIVVMVFLQTWRASIIPLVAVPVSLIGTFAVMLGFGFSLNTLSLFGLVLSIGIVVDDAIVVVENVERQIERGLTPIEATRRAMEEVSGPIIAIALVLCAVFVPTAFVSGLSGQFYRQFALTIAISTVISASIRSRSVRRSRRGCSDRGKRRVTWCSARRTGCFGWFFRRFNTFFHRASGCLHRRRGAGAAVFVRRARPVCRTDRAHGGRLYSRAAGIRPDAGQGVPRRVRATAGRVDAGSHGCRHPEDDGHRIEAPGGAELGGLSRTFDQRLRQRAEHRHCVRGVEAIRGAAQSGVERRRHRRDAESAVLRADPESVVAIFPPPPVQGLGTVGGFKLYLEDRRRRRIRGSLRTAAGRPGQGDRRCRRSPDCFPASRSACRRSTSTSIASA
jgi:multidrug efflux pump